VAATQCTAVIALLDAIPSRLLSALATEDRTKLVVARGALSSQIEDSPASFPLSRITPYGHTALWIIGDVLGKCPDELPDQKFKVLEFIKDDDLRASIELDLSAAHSALANSEFKASTVMAGSAIEALLLWALKDDRIYGAGKLLGFTPYPSGAPDMDRWMLDTYIKAADHAKLLDADTKKALELAQNYRNLIHAGRTERLGAKCNRGTAHSAVGALESLVVRLRGQLP
jgi:hypothetical protein